jgi:hypothetical protein
MGGAGQWQQEQTGSGLLPGKNPVRGRGDELVCLTERNENNLERQALLAFRRGMKT